MFLFKKGKRESSKVPLFQSYASATLVSGNFKKLVALPDYLDPNEWFATHVFDFFNFINLFYGSIAEYCTYRSCPAMNAGSCEYHWVDSSKRASKIPAPQYVDYVFTYIQNTTGDEFMFPTKADTEFSKDFLYNVKNIFKQLFRVLAHIYHSHFDIILHVSGEGHLNTLAAHFLAFTKEFDLIDKKELAPLQELMDEFEAISRI